MTKKDRSLILDRAESRFAAVSAISAVQLATGFTLEGYQTAITEARSRLAAYNGLLAQAENARREFATAERLLADLSERVLAAVGANYGKDSLEYGKAGGTPKSERKRSVRKAAPKTKVLDAA